MFGVEFDILEIYGICGLGSCVSIEGVYVLLGIVFGL